MRVLVAENLIGGICMEGIKNFFRKIWNGYKNWLGNKVWYKNWKVWLSIFVVFIIATPGASDESEAESTEPDTEEIQNEEKEKQEREEQEEAEREEQKKQEAKEKEEQEKKEQEEKEIELSTEEKIENAANDIFEDQLKEFSSDEGSDDYSITTKTAGVTVNMDKNSANVSTLDFLEKIQDEDFDSVYIEYQADFTDDYGEKSEDRAIVYVVDKATVDKINFDNVVINKMPNIADNYWEHPAYR